jgi:serine phosphatase RsbU (regulator of sigma subunit)
MLLSLFVVIGFIVGAMWLTTTVVTRRATRSLLNALTEQTLDQTENELTRFFEPVHLGMVEAKQWVGDGLIGPDNPEAVRALLQPLLIRFPQVSSMMVADESGREVMLLRRDTQSGVTWTVRQVVQDGDQTLVRFTDFVEGAPVFDEPLSFQEGFHYDPRSRPWFQNAVDLPDPSLTHWTEPYQFFTTKEPGITASSTVEGSGSPRIVIGFDMLLRDISLFTTRLRVRESGVVVVLTMPGDNEEAHIVGLPYRERYFDPEVLKADILDSPQEIGLDLLTEATRAIRNHPTALAGNPVRFRSDGTNWWTAHREHVLSPERSLVMGVLAPESELLFGITRVRWWNLAIACGMLVVAFFQIRRVANKFSEPVEELVRRSDEISTGELDDAQPIPASVFEISRLAEAQDRMRAALRSLLKVERDMALARSIQQRTFPEKLPMLEGFDIAAWSQPADETGGDTYDVIGYTLDEQGMPVLGDEGVDQAVLLLADATGHGIGPALSVTQVRSMLRIAVRMGGQIESIAVQMNHQLFNDLLEGRFVTTWLGHLDTTNATLCSISAGQGPQAFFSVKRDTLELFDADAPPLGILDEFDAVAPAPIVFESGDLFIAASDGIYEAAAPTGEQFGASGVETCVRSTLGESAERLIEEIRTSVERFTRGAPPADDQTIIIVRKR